MKQLSQVEVQQVAAGGCIPTPWPFPWPDPTEPVDLSGLQYAAL